MTDAPRCAACQAGAIDTEATYRSYGRDGTATDSWCAAHALPGDLPLAAAVDAVRKRVYPEVGEGMTDE